MYQAQYSGMQKALRTLDKRTNNAVSRFKQRGGTRLVSCSVRVENVCPALWLQSRSDLTRIYWSGRDDDKSVAGLGVADQWGSEHGCALARGMLSAKLRSADPGMRYYGGMAFDQSGALEHPWNVFGTCQFVLPRFELRSDKHGAELVCNLVFPQDAEDPEALKRQFLWPDAPPDVNAAGAPVIIQRTDEPNQHQWTAMVDRVLRAFCRPDLSKVVYARRARFRMNNMIDPTALLGKLVAQRREGFQFFFQVPFGPAFICNSPERLFRRSNGSLESEAVAGTLPRCELAGEDENRARQLMSCEKEQHEHELVRISLREQLEPHTSMLSLDPKPRVMRLPSTLHLHSKLEATMRDGVTSLDMLEGLHPTPAVGGYPTEPALAEIRAEEPFDRGWYAGPVGWIGADTAEFAVGIRSGLVEGDELTVYAGAGIVRGSTPAKEWQEIEHKIDSFMRMIGLQPCCNADALST